MRAHIDNIKLITATEPKTFHFDLPKDADNYSIIKIMNF